MFSYQFLEDRMDCLLFSFIPIIKGNFFTIKKNNLAINFDVNQAWKIAKQYFMTEYFYLNGHFVTKSLPSTSQAVVCTWDPAPGSADQSIGIHTLLDPRLDCNHMLYVSYITGWKKCADPQKPE